MQRRQEQQQKQAQSIAAKTPDIFTNTEASRSGEFGVVPETPCFVIRKVEWTGTENFRWIADKGRLLVGHCVGAKTLRTFQDYLSRKLLERGYITSRILIPEQSLADGTLKLRLLPGRISQVRDEGKSIGRHAMALSESTGSLLNQRDLDQGLENIRRLSSQQAATFDLVPGHNLGDTDIVIKHPDAKRWHGLATLDNSGTDATGKYQLGAVLVVDSPLHLYDILTVAVNNDASIGNTSLGTSSDSISWSVPYGYWSLFADANRSKYKQTVAGFDSDIVYSGRTSGEDLGAGRVLFRNAEAKTAFQVRLFHKTSHSDIDDTEVVVQQRDVVGYRADLTHRQYAGRAVWDFGLSANASLPGMSHAPGLIVGAPDWDGRYAFQTADADVMFPLQLGAQVIQVQSSFRAQHASTLLPATEFFSIGNRYTVRGFDGVATLAAEEGWTWRNDIAWPIGKSGQQIYFAADAGSVKGPSAAALLGRTLVGEAIGLRGKLSRFNYDITVGRPYSRPVGFQTDDPTFTVSVMAEF